MALVVCEIFALNLIGGWVTPTKLFFFNNFKTWTVFGSFSFQKRVVKSGSHE